jgi:protein tyrosine phosphatase (PTP) superfamily phosphohydrolase (DUF442 family)
LGGPSNRRELSDAQPCDAADRFTAGFRPLFRGRGSRTLAVMPQASRLSTIYQYRQATPTLATSGQPREEHLAEIAAAGYDVVINLALHDDPRYSLKDEAASVRKLGLEYVHIPVQFGAPTEMDLAKFFEAMDTHKNRRVWLHCAANMRVTVFLGLYRRLREGWSEDHAFELMDDIWEPDAVWSAFIRTQLEKSNAG